MLIGLLLTQREIDAAAGTLDAGEILDGNRLLHGNFGASHVFVNAVTDQITGIIDFEECGWGDPRARHVHLALLGIRRRRRSSGCAPGTGVLPTPGRGGTSAGTSRTCTSRSA